MDESKLTQDQEYWSKSRELGVSIQRFVQQTAHLSRLLGSLFIDGSFDKKISEEITKTISKNLELSQTINSDLTIIDALYLRSPAKEKAIQIKSYKDNYFNASKNFKSLQETALKKEKEKNFLSQTRTEEHPLSDVSPCEMQRRSPMERHRRGSYRREESNRNSRDSMRSEHGIGERLGTVGSLDGDDLLDDDGAFQNLSLSIVDQGAIVRSLEGTAPPPTSNSGGFPSLHDTTPRYSDQFALDKNKLGFICIIFTVTFTIGLMWLLVWGLDSLGV